MYIRAPRSATPFKVRVDENGRVVVELQRALPDHVLKGLRGQLKAGTQRLVYSTKEFAYAIMFTPRKGSGQTPEELRDKLESALPEILAAMPPLVVASVIKLDPNISGRSKKMLGHVLMDVTLETVEASSEEFHVLWRGLEDEPVTIVVGVVRDGLSRLNVPFTETANPDGITVLTIS